MGNSPDSSTGSWPPLDLRPRRSLSLALVQGISHLLALLALSLLAWPWPLRLLAASAVALSAWRTLGAPPAPRLRRQADGGWRRGEEEGDPVELLGWYAQPWLCVLIAKATDGRRCAWVLPRDALDADAHRRLRVALALSGHKQAETSPAP